MVSVWLLEKNMFDATVCLFEEDVSQRRNLLFWSKKICFLQMKLSDTFKKEKMNPIIDVFD